MRDELQSGGKKLACQCHSKSKSTPFKNTPAVKFMHIILSTKWSSLESLATLLSLGIKFSKDHNLSESNYQIYETNETDQQRQRLHSGVNEPWFIFFNCQQTSTTFYSQMWWEQHLYHVDVTMPFFSEPHKSSSS